MPNSVLLFTVFQQYFLEEQTHILLNLLRCLGNLSQSMQIIDLRIKKKNDLNCVDSRCIPTLSECVHEVSGFLCG